MINQNSIKRITDKLTEKYGLSMTSILGSDEKGTFIKFMPVELHEAEGFSIRTVIGWRSISVEFIPGKFSALLIKTMGEADAEKRTIFKSFAELAVSKSGHLIMRVNGLATDPIKTELWPSMWKMLEMNLKYVPIVLEDYNPLEIEDIIFNCTSNLHALVVSLLPLFESDREIESSIEGLPEGSVTRIEVNRYERNRLNRAICIEKRGTRCVVCGYSFGEVFGQIGEGFIHIHHTTPVSQIGEDYIIDPENDLVPVCANCHAMLHRKDPPYSTDELKDKIRS